MRKQATASTSGTTRAAEKATADHRGDVRTKTTGVSRRGKPGAYYFSVRFTDAEGKRDRKRFDAYEDAVAFRATIKREVKQGTYRKVEAVTFKDYAEKWAANYRGRGRTPIRDRTKGTYRRQISGAVDVLGGASGRKPLAAITSDDIAAFIDHLYGLGHIPDTVQRHMTPLKMVMAQALREGRITTDPTKGIPMIPSDLTLLPPESDDEEKAKALTHDEVTALLARIPEKHMLMVQVALQTGLRISELLGLRWRDVEDDGIHVRQAVVGGQVGLPKSKKSRRRVPASPELLHDLRVRRLASRHSLDDDLVFASESGKPAHASNHYRWFKKAAREAGVDWAAFHNLRHTAASRWFHKGYMLTVVSKLLGHSDASFTLRTYIHVIPSDLPNGRDLAAAIGL